MKFSYFHKLGHKGSNIYFFFLGCDTGFGHLLARRLDSMGYKVFAGCLYPKSEEVEKLIDTTSNNLQVVQIDVTQDDSVRNALKVVEKSLGRNGKDLILCVLLL